MKKIVLTALASMVLASAPASSQEDPAIASWPAPPYWSPPAGGAQPSPGSPSEPAERHGARQALVLPSSPLPFVAITPCRMADTRAASGFPAGYGPPSLPGGGTQRSFTITGRCGIPANAQAVSFNFTIWAPVTRGTSGSSRPEARRLRFPP